MKKKSIILLMFIIIIVGCIVVKGTCTNSNNSPSACGSYQNDWTNPTNAYSQNDVNAVAQVGSSLTNEEDYYNFGFSMPSPAIILGIEILMDGYTGSTSYGFNVKLSWNSGSTWTSTQSITGFSGTDTDNYVAIGGVSDLWGHSWTLSELSNANFKVDFLATGDVGRRIYVDHIKINVYYTIYPVEPSEVKYYIHPINCNYINLTYQMNSYTDQCLIRYSTSAYPTTTLSGTYLYEGYTNPYSTNIFSSGTVYYLSIWAKNNSCGDYSLTYDTLYLVTPCSNDIDIIENIINATGESEYSYSNKEGYIIYVNYTGNETICDNTSLTVYNNTAFTDGKYETNYNMFTGWKIYLNYTGILPNFNHYENIVNATGTHEYNINNFGYTINSWANYTGNITECPPFENCCPSFNGIYYYNHSNKNLTINISVDYAFDNETCIFTIGETYNNTNINEDNWLNLASTLFFDNSQIFLFILIALWTFFISKFYDTRRTLFSIIQFGLCIPLTISIALLSLSYAFGYIIIFIIPSISIYIVIEGHFYNKKQKKLK